MGVGAGWIGPEAVLLNYLATVGADRDEAGAFLIAEEPVSSFMGQGDEVLIPAGTVYLVGGRPVPLAASMVAVMGSGAGRGLGVTVIS